MGIAAEYFLRAWVSIPEMASVHWSHLLLVSPRMQMRNEAFSSIGPDKSSYGKESVIASKLRRKFDRSKSRFQYTRLQDGRTQGSDGDFSAPRTLLVLRGQNLLLFIQRKAWVKFLYIRTKSTEYWMDTYHTDQTADTLK